MVKKRSRRGKRVWVIDFTYTKPDGMKGRYRRDAEVQTAAAARWRRAALSLRTCPMGHGPGDRRI